MAAKVSLVRCRTYDEEEVQRSLRQSIGLLGGMERFIRRGDRVLLKPNLLFGKRPEKAVTTHPSIVKGMIRMVREAGGTPFIGDSPGIGNLVKTAEKAGIKSVADEMDCPLVEFDRPVLSPKAEGRVFKHLELDRSALEADVVINLPKWKTHGMMFLTLGIKNLFGCVPGQKKVLWHIHAGEDRRVFAQMLVDIYQTLRPSLTLLDGVVGMEGNGPNSGNPVQLGVILASEESLSLDQAVCDLLGISRKTLITNRVALERGMGRNGFDLLGERVEKVKIPRFAFPPPSQTDYGLPRFLKRVLNRALCSRPIVQKVLCSACDRCVEICPPKSLTRRKGDLVFDYRHCIRCFCCQEICPEGAILMQPGWVLKLVGRRQ